MITLDMWRKIRRGEFDAPIGHRKGPRPAFGPAETKEAEAMIARGESVAEIAQRFGVSEGYVYVKFRIKQRRGKQ